VNGYLDPLVEGSGLTRGNKLEKVVWDEYHNNYDRLREVTESIISHIESKDLPEFIDDDDEDDVEFTEGKILKRVHNVRERKSGIVKKKKEKVLSETGKLECEVCGFDFYEVYGELGKGFCECHHKIPLHQLNQVKKTKMSDLSIVCSNCHRMLHRSKTVMSVEELGEVMEENIGVP
jgi:5-methylcytosine-specific restriction protein A